MTTQIVEQFTARDLARSWEDDFSASFLAKNLLAKLLRVLNIRRGLLDCLPST